MATMQDAITAGVRLCKRARLAMALVTLDRDGMVWVQADGQGEAFPTCSRQIYDITGAGDMVLAMLGLCFGSSVDFRSAVRLANVAAGLEVERPGVAILRRDEIASSLAADHAWSKHKIVGLAEARQLAEEYRRQGLSIVFTNGCFDLLHVGHIANLNEAAGLGHRLFVAINSDSSVRKLKGPGRPLIHDRDRAVMVAAPGRGLPRAGVRRRDAAGPDRGDSSQRAGQRRLVRRRRNRRSRLRSLLRRRGPPGHDGRRESPRPRFSTPCGTSTSRSSADHPRLPSRRRPATAPQAGRQTGGLTTNTADPLFPASTDATGNEFEKNRAHGAGPQQSHG